MGAAGIGRRKPGAQRLPLSGLPRPGGGQRYLGHESPLAFRDPRDDEVGVRDRGRVKVRAVGVEHVGNDQSPVHGAHNIGWVGVQRSAPRQLPPSPFVHTPHDVDQIGDLRGPPSDCPVKGDGLVLGDRSKPFQHLQIAAAGQTTVREQLRDLRVCAASRYSAAEYAPVGSNGLIRAAAVPSSERSAIAQSPAPHGVHPAVTNACSASR
jgi:hypothetical protein